MLTISAFIGVFVLVGIFILALFAVTIDDSWPFSRRPTQPEANDRQRDSLDT
jgi:hypothetical protein